MSRYSFSSVRLSSFATVKHPVQYFNRTARYCTSTVTFFTHTFEVHDKKIRKQVTGTMGFNYAEDEVINVVTHIVCPIFGGIMANLMFAAPAIDLRNALIKGSLGVLNPFPWVMMTGNCLGWVAYGYYLRDPFVVGANTPGLILSIWLNMGAVKLQYLEIKHERESESEKEGEITLESTTKTVVERENFILVTSKDETNDDTDDDEISGNFICVPQESAFLTVLILWTVILIYVGWMYHPLPQGGDSKTDPANFHPAADIIGWIVNVNLVFFYGAPLNTIRQVFSTKTSESIHRPTMYMGWSNATFWIIYGLAIKNFIIILPNSVGLLLGLFQGLLCLCYPRKPLGYQEQMTEENTTFQQVVDPSIV